MAWKVRIERIWTNAATSIRRSPPPLPWPKSLAGWCASGITRRWPWLGRAEQSQLPELLGFVAGIRRDKTAVEQMLLSPWSNGQVEGQVNRLKVLKRQMYGRANFDLLRKRVLYAA